MCQNGWNFFPRRLTPSYQSFLFGQKYNSMGWGGGYKIYSIYTPAKWNFPLPPSSFNIFSFRKLGYQTDRIFIFSHFLPYPRRRGVREQQTICIFGNNYVDVLPYQHWYSWKKYAYEILYYIGKKRIYLTVHWFYSFLFLI